MEPAPGILGEGYCAKSACITGATVSVAPEVRNESHVLSTMFVGLWQDEGITVSIVVIPRRCLIPSKTAKKKVLSFTIGPPNAAPKLLR